MRMCAPCGKLGEKLRANRLPVLSLAAPGGRLGVTWGRRSAGLLGGRIVAATRVEFESNHLTTWSFAMDTDHTESAAFWTCLDLDEEHVYADYKESTEGRDVYDGVLLRTSSWVTDEYSMERNLLFIPGARVAELQKRDRLWINDFDDGTPMPTRYDEYPHFQDRTERFEVGSGLVVRSIFCAWNEGGRRRLTESLVFIPSARASDFCGGVA
jgi:hypothetical protein